MKNIKTILITSGPILLLLLLNKLEVFKNPIAGAVIVILIVLSYPIGWRIIEYIKKKYPDMIQPKKCPSCGFEIPEDTNHCPKCATVLEHQITIDDKFEEDGKVKKICPRCGLKELETIYEISRGYKEVCASCGKSRVSRRAKKVALGVLFYFIAIMLLFYWLFQSKLK